MPSKSDWWDSLDSFPFLPDIEDVAVSYPEGTAAPLFFGSGDLDYLVRYDVETFNRLHVCVFYGAVFLYPDIWREIVWDFLRPVEYPYPIPTGAALLDNVVAGGDLLVTTNNPQSLVTGINVVANWCKNILVDDTGLATQQNNDRLYLPPGDYGYSIIQAFDNRAGAGGFAYLFLTGADIDAENSVAPPSASASNNTLVSNGAFTIADGEYVRLYINTSATGEHLGSYNDLNEARYCKAHFWRISNTDPDPDPDPDPEWPCVFDLTQGSIPTPWQIWNGEGTLDGASGLKGDDIGSVNRAQIECTFTAQTITDVSCVFKSGTLQTPGSGNDSLKIQGLLSGSQVFVQYTNYPPDNTDPINAQWTGSETIDELRIWFQADDPSEVWIKSVSVTGEGVPIC